MNSTLHVQCRETFGKKAKERKTEKTSFGASKQDRDDQDNEAEKFKESNIIIKLLFPSGKRGCYLNMGVSL